MRIKAVVTNALMLIEMVRAWRVNLSKDWNKIVQEGADIQNAFESTVPEGRVRDMEVLIGIGLIALGAAIGAIVMGCLATAGYADVLDEMYKRGFENGQKEERQKWLRIQEKVFDTARESKQ